MLKIRNRIVLVLVLVMLLAAGTAVLSACGSETYTVTFMVRENGIGEYRQYTTAETDDGVIVLPADPSVDGYTFRDWYTDEACTNVFDETKVEGDITVYALMSENEVLLNVTDGTGVTTALASGSFATLSETTVAQEQAATADNLTFDGWYTDTAFTQKYSDGMDATALYGRYMAQVTIDDGYATVYKVLVTPGSAMSQPAEEDILQYYMGEIVYYTQLYADGEIAEKDGNGAAAAFDFTTEIDANTALRVMWASPDLEYELNEATGNLTMTGFGENLQTAPIVSIPAYATLDGESTVRLVEAVIWGKNIYDVCPAATKIIFADGIKSISGVQGSPLGGTLVSEIVLPDTLKIIDTAFWNLQAIKGFDIPDGVEVIINSFWAYCAQIYDTYTKNSYAFDITIPASVTNISQAPSNFVYAEGSSFRYDETTNATYKKGVNNDYRTLISMYDTGDTITVKDGVEYIQVGAFNGSEFEYLYIPSSFRNVAYNADAEDYGFYIGGVNDSGYNKGGFRLYDSMGGGYVEAGRFLCRYSSIVRTHYN